ncbi:retrovirus-related pol polyprotein from transposon TNT 1-94 [Tanacetum coccineum]
MMIFNDMHEPHVQSVSDTTQNTVVDNSLTAELATYKEQVKLYERRARFELTEREQKIDEQLRIVITDRNIKEENLKKELHSDKNSTASTITKQVNEKNKVAIGYKNPLCLTRTKQVQPALYNGYEIIKNNHVPTLVHNTEDTLEIAKITRRKMNDKMKDPECVTHKVKIAPLNYLKENYLATFTPQKQLTPEQIFWSQDLIKMKEKALKEQTTASRTIKALTVYPPNTPATLLKYQNLKESFGNNPSPPARETPDFDSVFVIGKMKASLQCKDNVIEKLKMQIFQLKETHSEADRTLDFRTLDEKVTVLQEQNELFRAENEKVKHHYKELYAIDVKPIPPNIRNNREVHLDCPKHLKESVETLREIVEEDKVERLLDRSLISACLYTKHSQELLEYAIGTCPKDFNQKDKKHAYTPLNKKKQVTFEDQYVTSNNNTHKHVEQQNIQKTNVPVLPPIGVNSCTNVSGSQPRSNTKKHRISPAKSVNKKKVEEHTRTNNSSLKTMNRVDSSISSKRTVINLNSHSICQTCNKCLISANHDMCVVDYLHSMNASPSIHNVVRKVKQVWKPKQVRQVWKATGKVFTSVGHQWRPTGRIVTLGEQCPLTRLTKPKVVSAKQTENQAISCANQQEPTKIRDPTFQTLHLCLFSNAGLTDRPLVFGLKLLKTYDGGSLTAQEFYEKVHRDIEDMMKSSPICLLSKASKNKSWLWHRRLNHLNFGTINDLTRKDLVRGLPRLKFEKDHLCSACQL